MNPLSLEHCDLLIVGAGPAGMAAAVAAAPSGATIAVIDDNPAPGGQIWRGGPAAHLPPAAVQWRAALERCANVRVHPSTRVIAALAGQQLLLEDADRGWRLQWGKLILCTGARELLLPFPGWTLPGVTGAGALQALIKGGLPVRGERIVIAGSGPLLLAAAATARQAGAQVVQVAEQASLGQVADFALNLARWPAKALQALTLANRHYRTSSHVSAALGRERVSGAQIQHGNKQNNRPQEVACERIACGFGLVPNTELGQALGCALVVSVNLATDQASQAPALAVDHWQATSLPGIYAAGECTGFGGSERALVQGSIAGYAATDQQQAAQQRWPERARYSRFAAQLQRNFALQPALQHLSRPDTLVCRCEDVTYAELAEQAQLGGWREAKLHSRCGMGACQGRVCGAATQFLFGWTPSAPRPPLSPARIATLAALVDDSALSGLPVDSPCRWENAKPQSPHQPS